MDQFKRIVSALMGGGAPWAFDNRSNEMEWTPDEIVEIILRDGPFPGDLVMTWPADMRRDYFELFTVDLAELGLEELRQQRRLLGEAYLLSFGEPILTNRILLAAWWALTGGERPPPPPEFTLG